MEDQLQPCPQCGCPYGYALSETRFECPECQHQWDLNTDTRTQEDVLVVIDANGNTLQNGDTVIVIKNLPVKGSASSIKPGTKVKNIRLSYGDHNIDCKIEGFGAMALKSEFVKKA